MNTPSTSLFQRVAIACIDAMDVRRSPRFPSIFPLLTIGFILWGAPTHPGLQARVEGFINEGSFFMRYDRPFPNPPGIEYIAEAGGAYEYTPAP